MNGEDRLYTGNNTHKHSNKEDRIQWSTRRSSQESALTQRLRTHRAETSSSSKIVTFLQIKTNETLLNPMFFLLYIWQSLMVINNISSAPLSRSRTWQWTLTFKTPPSSFSTLKCFCLYIISIKKFVSLLRRRVIFRSTFVSGWLQHNTVSATFHTEQHWRYWKTLSRLGLSGGFNCHTAFRNMPLCEESCHYESSTMVMRTENPHIAMTFCKKTALWLWKTLFILNVSVIVKFP